jgi:hypothetical protein
MHPHVSFNNVWIIDSLNPNDRFERQGEPVSAGECVLFRHCQTTHYLASDKKSFKNDFGTEFEVSAHSYNTINKTQNLHLEKQGAITSDVPCRFQGEQNHFTIETAPSADFDMPIEELNQMRSSDLIAQIKYKILEQSSYGIRKIAKIFSALDKNGDQRMDVDDFRWAFIDYGFQITKPEAQHLLEAFDKDGNGLVDFGEFLSVIKVSFLFTYNFLGRNVQGKRRCRESCIRKDGLRSRLHSDG